MATSLAVLLPNMYSGRYMSHWNCSELYTLELVIA
jgi:hypothetical protein